MVVERTYRSQLANFPLRPTKVSLRAYNGENISLLGEIQVPVLYGGRRVTLPLIVARGDKPALFGRNWLGMIRLDWGRIVAVKTNHANADALSRLPDASSQPGDEMHDFPIHQVSFADELSVLAKYISEATRKDPILSKVVEYTKNGWPIKVTDDQYMPFYRRRSELSADQGCLLWGLRVVIPLRFRKRLLYEFHDEHHGILRMKGLARCYLCWPGLDADIEETIRDCETCQSVRNMPAEAPLHPRVWPTRVWQRVHVDFAEKDKQMFLVMIDAH